MTCREFQSELADELAGEPTARDSRAIRSHAAECESCARELRSLSDVQHQLRMGLVSRERAESAAAAVVPGFRAAASPSTLRLPALVRYAAMIAIGFLAGYSLQGSRGNAIVSASPSARETTLVAVDPIHQSISSRYRAAEAAYPGASMFSRSLVAVARP